MTHIACSIFGLHKFLKFFLNWILIQHNMDVHFANLLSNTNLNYSAVSNTTPFTLSKLFSISIPIHSDIAESSTLEISLEILLAKESVFLPPAEIIRISWYFGSFSFLVKGKLTW